MTTAPVAKTAVRDAEKAAPFEPQKVKAGIENAITEVRARIDKKSAEPPTAITSEERESGRQAQMMLLHVLTTELDTLARISEDEKLREAAEKAEREWTRFTDPPPYSNLLADDIREQEATRRTALELLKASREAMQGESERFGSRAKRAEENVRRTAEALEASAVGSDARAVAHWRLEAARDASRLASAFVASANLSGRELEMRIAIAQAELRLSERQVAALAGKIRITEADLAGAQARLDAARAQWAKDQQIALDQAAKWAEERERAAAELQAARAAQPPGRDSTEHEHALRLAEARMRAADAWSDGLTQQVRILTVLISIYYDRIVEAWNWRYEALSRGDPDSRRQARKQLAELVDYLKGWESRSRAQQNEVQSAIQEQGQRILSATDPLILKYENDALAALRQLDRVFERQQAVLARRLGRLAYWREDFADGPQGRPLREAIGDAYVRASALARSIWNYELMKIEDKVEIGGQILTTARGVTVAKAVGALVLFLIALRLMMFLSVRMEKLMVRRFAATADNAKMMRHWVNALGIIIVLMLALNMARIPLTVFAFAGGALAIGIGFGMQTLIKNLISGVIVLLERHVRVGDVIEVDGVTGVVTAVDIRSSTVRGTDGLESLVPNALLLEQKVTNWTLANADRRWTIKVAVVYGSPVRMVAQILEGCAARHGLVLKEPAPTAIFEDFGESALVFTLYFWHNLLTSNVQQVMSDLRFMIEKELREAGIVMAVPQREVRLDATRPITVTLASPAEPLKPEGVHRIVSSFSR